LLDEPAEWGEAVLSNGRVGVFVVSQPGGRERTESWCRLGAADAVDCLRENFSSGRVVVECEDDRLDPELEESCDRTGLNAGVADGCDVAQFFGLEVVNVHEPFDQDELASFRRGRRTRSERPYGGNAERRAPRR